MSFPGAHDASPIYNNEERGISVTSHCAFSPTFLVYEIPMCYSQTSIFNSTKENEREHVGTKAAELVCPFARAFSLTRRASAVGARTGGGLANHTQHTRRAGAANPDHNVSS